LADIDIGQLPPVKVQTGSCKPDARRLTPEFIGSGQQPTLHRSISLPHNGRRLEAGRTLGQRECRLLPAIQLSRCALILMWMAPALAGVRCDRLASVPDGRGDV